MPDKDLQELARQLHELNGTDGEEECMNTLSELRTIAMLIEEVFPSEPPVEEE